MYGSPGESYRPNVSRSSHDASIRLATATPGEVIRPGGSHPPHAAPGNNRFHQRKASCMSGDLVLSVLLVIALYGLGVALLRLT